MHPGGFVEDEGDLTLFHHGICRVGGAAAPETVRSEKEGTCTMAQMSEKVQEMFAKTPLAVVATATANGIPNAVPIAMKQVVDAETLLISDQFFHKTHDNLAENPRVAITFWEGNDGYQIKGSVTLQDSGELYEKTAAWVEEAGKAIGAPLKSKGIAVVKVEEVYSIAPGPQAGARLA